MSWDVHSVGLEKGGVVYILKDIFNMNKGTRLMLVNFGMELRLLKRSDHECQNRWGPKGI